MACNRYIHKFSICLIRSKKFNIKGAQFPCPRGIKIGGHPPKCLNAIYAMKSYKTLLLETQC